MKSKFLMHGALIVGMISVSCHASWGPSIMSTNRAMRSMARGMRQEHLKQAVAAAEKTHAAAKEKVEQTKARAERHKLYRSTLQTLIAGLEGVVVELESDSQSRENLAQYMERYPGLDITSALPNLLLGEGVYQALSFEIETYNSLTPQEKAITRPGLIAVNSALGGRGMPIVRVGFETAKSIWSEVLVEASRRGGELDNEWRNAIENSNQAEAELQAARQRR